MLSESHVIERLAMIPNIHRQFNISEDEAKQQIRACDESFRRLIEAGLPYYEKNSGRFFDQYDILNLSLNLGKTTYQTMAMRTWGSTLKLLEKHGSISADVEYCITSPRQNETEYSILLPGGTRQNAQPWQGSIIYQNHFVLKPQKITIPKNIQILLEQVNQFDFYMLPETIRWNQAFIKQSHYCECGAASKYLYMLARQQHLPARLAFGILVAQPYSTCHYWVELLINGKWASFDPLLIKLLHKISKLDPKQWPINRPIDGLVIPLAYVEAFCDRTMAPLLQYHHEYVLNPILLDGEGKEVKVTLPTTLAIS